MKQLWMNCKLPCCGSLPPHPTEQYNVQGLGGGQLECRQPLRGQLSGQSAAWHVQSPFEPKGCRFQHLCCNYQWLSMLFQASAPWLISWKPRAVGLSTPCDHGLLICCTCQVFRSLRWCQMTWMLSLSQVGLAMFLPHLQKKPQQQEKLACSYWVFCVRKLSCCVVAYAI